MVRLQVQLTESQLKALRELAASTGKSIAELVREGVDIYLSAQRRTVQLDRALAIAGKFSSGVKDVSEHHDRYLSEAFHS